MRQRGTLRRETGSSTKRNWLRMQEAGKHSSNKSVTLGQTDDEEEKAPLVCLFSLNTMPSIQPEFSTFCA